MTLILGVTGPESIWLLADRRLSGTVTRNDARKLLRLEATDGVAILGYAGLGATPRTEPADWMAATLRDRKRPMEATLSFLAGAMRRQLPRHLLRMPNVHAPAHNVVIPALVNGKPKLYAIDVVTSRDGRAPQLTFRN